MDGARVGQTDAPEHQQDEQHRKQGGSGVDSRVAFQVHEVGCDTVAFDDANADEDGPHSVKRDVDVGPGDFLEEDGCHFEQCEKHQHDEVPEVDVKVARQLVHDRFKNSSCFMFSHSLTSIQIEGWEDDHPSQVNKVPVEAEVLDTLCVLFVVADGVGLEDQVQHHQQTNEHVNAVSTG